LYGKGSNILSNKKEDRRSQRTRRLLHQAVMSLMQEKRYNSITVQDIIDRADVGRSTFYAHYQDKEDLVNNHLQEILDDLSQSLTDNAPNNQRLIPTLALFKHVRAHQPIFEAMGGGRGLDLLLEKARTYWCKRVETELQSRFPAGQTPAKPFSLVAGYLTGALVVYLKWWFEYQLSCSPERLDEMFQQMVMPGVWAALGESGLSRADR
jgi:AcrR family transcriptional regulator